MQCWSLSPLLLSHLNTIFNTNAHTKTESSSKLIKKIASSSQLTLPCWLKLYQLQVGWWWNSLLSEICQLLYSKKIQNKPQIQRESQLFSVKRAAFMVLDLTVCIDELIKPFRSKDLSISLTLTFANSFDPYKRVKKKKENNNFLFINWLEFFTRILSGQSSTDSASVIRL